MKARFGTIFLIFFAVFFISNSFGVVEVFSQYDTKISVSKNYTIDVEKNIMLKNVHDVGIVPGQIEFKIEYPNDKIVELISYLVTDRYGNEIRSSTYKKGDSTYIVLDIFMPVLPGFEYKINLKYTLSYESSGFFFKTFQVPLKENTKIPIEKGIVEVSIPENYYITYIGFEDENTVIDERTITWQIENEKIPNSVTLEYSYLPVGFGGIRGSLIFWLTINIVLIIILVLEILKETKKLKNN